MVVAAFVAPFLLPATARFVGTAAQLPGRPAGRHHHRAGRAGARRAAPSTSPGTGGSTTRSTRGRSPRRSPGLSRQLGPVRAAGRGAGAAAGAARPGPRGARHPGHGRRDRAQRPRQVPDEDGAARGRRPVRPPPAGHRRRRGARVRRGGRLPARREAAGRRRRAGDLPARRRRRAAQLARGDSRRGPRRPGCSRSSSSARSTRSTASASAGGRSGRRSSDYLPPPLDVLRNPWIQWTVLLPRELDDPRYDGIRDGRPGRAAGARRARRADAHGVVPPPGRLGRGVRGRRPPAGRADLVDARLRARRRLLPDVGRAGDARPVRPAGAASSPPARCTCADRDGAGSAPCTGSRSCSAGSGTSSSRRGCPSPASRRRRATKGEGYVIVRASGDRGRPRRAAADRRGNPGRAGGGRSDDGRDALAGLSRPRWPTSPGRSPRSGRG